MIGDVYRCALRQVLNGRDVVNTVFLRMKTNPEPTASMFSASLGAFVSVLTPAQVDDLEHLDWVATQVRGAGTTYSTTPPFRTSTVSYAGGYSPATPNGQLTSTPLPNSVALVAALNTAQAGRRRKGRLYVGGISELWVDDNSMVNSTQLATLQSGLDLIVSQYGASGSNADFEWGVWSDRIATNTKYVWTTSGPVLTSQGAPDPANAFAAIVSVVCRSYVGSQRDRRPGL